MANTRTIFNTRGEGVNVHPAGTAHPGVTLTVSVRADRVRQIGNLIHVDFELPQERGAGALIALIGDNAKLAVEVRPRGETWDERLHRERKAVVLKRLHLKPEEHDLWATGDQGIPASICDSNGEVVLGCCRKCGRAEAQLDDVPACDGVMPITISEAAQRIWDEDPRPRKPGFVGLLFGEPVYR